jgi:hypothetical protein
LKWFNLRFRYSISEQWAAVVIQRWYRAGYRAIKAVMVNPLVTDSDSDDADSDCEPTCDICDQKQWVLEEKGIFWNGNDGTCASCDPDGYDEYIKDSDSDSDSDSESGSDVFSEQEVEKPAEKSDSLDLETQVLVVEHHPPLSVIRIPSGIDLEDKTKVERWDVKFNTLRIWYVGSDEAVEVEPSFSEDVDYRVFNKCTIECGEDYGVYNSDEED